MDGEEIVESDALTAVWYPFDMAWLHLFFARTLFCMVANLFGVDEIVAALLGEVERE